MMRTPKDYFEISKPLNYWNWTTKEHFTIPLQKIDFTNLGIDSLKDW